MIDSRLTVAVALTVGLLVGAISTEAQPAERPVKIGVLSPDSRETSVAVLASFRQGLRDLGWEDGQNIVIEVRFADGKLERLHDLSEELLNLKVSLIVAKGIEFSLLPAGAVSRGASGLGFERAMHALVTSILLRFARFDELGKDP